MGTLPYIWPIRKPTYPLWSCSWRKEQTSTRWIRYRGRRGGQGL